MSGNTIPFRLGQGGISNNLHVKPAGQGSDSSNTSMVYDGISWTGRAQDGHHKTGIVVFIDVLGMKGMSQRYKPREIFSKWRNVTGSFSKVLQEGYINAGYFFRILSDTIIITIPTELNQSAINGIFDLLRQPFIDSIKTGLLLRGIVSHDEYYLSQQLIIGPAVDDAASNHDELDWIGIALSPNVYIRGGNTVNNSVVYYNIPLKNSYPGIALNWPKFDLNRECYQILQKEYGQTPEKAKVKYENTFSFYNYVTYSVIVIVSEEYVQKPILLY
ncbi:MAG: hypothetical protein WBF33_38730 [Candidatus Nitrosopolaris sp.]